LKERVQFSVQSGSLLDSLKDPKEFEKYVPFNPTSFVDGRCILWWALKYGAHASVIHKILDLGADPVFCQSTSLNFSADVEIFNSPQDIVERFLLLGYKPSYSRYVLPENVFQKLKVN
jgi:hypothetical protein